MSDKCKERKNSLSFDKPSEWLNLNNNAEKELEKQWKKDCSFFSEKNKSTLSLHIAAYEKSVEDVAVDPFGGKNKKDLKNGISESTGNKKQVLTSKLNVHNPFEFLRQQNGKLSDPEMFQFKASQSLINPNEASNNGQQGVSYEIIEINAWKIENGIYISLATFLIGLFLALLHIGIVFFTPKDYLLNENSTKKPAILAECRPTPTVSNPQKKRRNRPTKNQIQPKNDNQFFYIDTTHASGASAAQQQSIPTDSTKNFDEEFLDRLKADIRYYPKLTLKNNEFRRTAFSPHIHGRITECQRKRIPGLSIEFELKHSENAAENVDSLISVISDESATTNIAKTDATTTTEAEIPKTTPFSRFLTQFIEMKDIEDVQRDALKIPIKENDSIYKTLKNVKHGF
uniref:Uncharacterized protein n=1 Tax=Panagrolaimus davidi TaxID=227884 RepID=A0A914QGU6_9BILA